jgi:hypothetical protein
VCLTVFSTVPPFINAPPAQASGWSGWDAISAIYYNTAQEDIHNPFLETAADELSTFLEQMSGRSWSIVHADPSGPAVRLQVNPNAPEFSGLGDEATRIIVDNNGVRISGKTAIAVREGAYLFLYDLGVRWLMPYEPYWTIVPDSLPAIEALDEVNEPDYVFRRLWSGEPSDRGDLWPWRKRNLLGGAATYEVSHAYFNIMPQALYGTYPDAYLPEGQPPPGTADNWQVKPDHPVVIDRAIAYGLAHAAAEYSTFNDTDDVLPDRVVSISPNDGWGWGSYFDDDDWTHDETINLTNLVTGLADAVAVALADAGSDMYAGLYNYSWYSDIITIPLEGNVFVEIATSYDYSNVPETTRIANLHDAGALVGIREYYDPWQWYWDGVPNWAKKDLNNIKKWYDYGCAVYNGEGGDSWGSAGIVYYIASRLLYDTSLTYEEVLDDFCENAYGPAAGTMKKFYNLWFDGMELGNNSYAVAFRYLDQALTQAEGDGDVINRINYEVYWMYYVWKVNRRDTMPKSELEDFYTFTTKLSTMYVLHYHYAERQPREALRARFPGDWPNNTAVWSALTDNTVPIAAEARIWLDEALEAFASELGVEAFYINPMELDLVPLGDTEHEVYPPIFTRTDASTIFTASAGETVQLTLRGSSPDSSKEFFVYDEEGNLIDTIPTTGNDWTPASVTVPATGKYRISGGGSIDVVDHPAGQIGGQFRGHNSYIYVPEGTAGLLIEFEDGCEASELYDPDGNLAGTYTGGLDTLGVDSPAPGLWHFHFGGMDTTQKFEIYGVPDLVWHDPEWILVPAAGSIPHGSNRTPIFNTIGNRQIDAGETVEFTVSANDPDGDAITYSASHLPAGATFDPSSGVFTWATTTTQAGTYSNIRFSASDGSDTDYEYISITVLGEPTNPSQSGTSSGGGGGGGGGGKGVTRLSDSTTDNGRVVVNVVAEDAEQKVKLLIPEDTIVRASTGQGVSSIIIKPSTEMLALDAGSFPIGSFYNFSPSGTTFSPSATLVFKYSDAMLPAGTSENSLFVALWDPASYRWTDLGGTIDSELNTASVEVQHLSTYALMAHARTASFELSSATIDRSEVSSGEPVTLSVIVSNVGDAPGTYQAALRLDDAVIDTRSVDLAGLESRTLQFTLTSDVAGKHTASIGDLSVSFDVIKPLAQAEFLTSNLAVSPSAVMTGDKVDVFVLVMNAGGLPGNYTINLKIDDVGVQSRDIQLDGGKSELVSFSIDAGPAGQHTVDINGLTAVYTVHAPVGGSQEATRTTVDIAEFHVNPVYSSETGNIISTRINYSLSGSLQQVAGGGLSLKVYRDGVLLEEVPLHWLNQPQSDDLDYVPALGWEAGSYTFLAQLRTTGSETRIAGPAQFAVAPVAVAAVVSWNVLAIIIGATLVVTMILVTIVVIRRRDMLRWRY